jgi:hypothetical protein
VGIAEVAYQRGDLAATGDRPAAAQELAGTLALAAAQGYVRVFADEGPPMAALLTQVATAHRDGDSPPPGRFPSATWQPCYGHPRPPARHQGSRAWSSR